MGGLDFPLSANAPIFAARYPFALLLYPDAARPVSVTLSAFSPLLPYDVRNSSFPGFLLTFQLKNETNEPVEVSAALSVESLMGKSRGEAGIRFVSVPAAEGNFGGRFSGGNANAGEMVVQVQPPRGDAEVSLTGWNPSEKTPDWWNDFAKEGRVSSGGEKPSAPTSHSAAVLVVRLTLKPRERIEIPFSIAWSFPHPPRKETPGAFALTPREIFPNALLTSRELLNQRLSLTALTEEWQSRLLSSNLPQWLQEALINSLMPLTTNIGRTVERPVTIFTVPGQIATPLQSQPALLALNDLYPTLLPSSVQTTPLKGADGNDPLKLLENDKPDLALSLLERRERDQKAGDNSVDRLATWGILSALWGFAHTQDEVALTPRIPGTWRSLRAPIFASGFWAYGEFIPRARGYSLSFRLDRTFAVRVEGDEKPKRPSAAPDLTIASLILPSPPRVGTSPPTFYARLRQSALGIRVTALPDNKIRLTFDTPLHLVAGDRIDLEAK